MLFAVVTLVLAAAASSQAGPLPTAISLIRYPVQPKQQHAMRVVAKAPEPVRLVAQAKAFSQTHYLRTER
jgi:hypothetical protein